MHVYMHVKHACKNMHVQFLHACFTCMCSFYMHVLHACKHACLHACKNMHVYMHVNMHVTKHACYMHVFTCMSDFTGVSKNIKERIIMQKNKKNFDDFSTFFIFTCQSHVRHNKFFYQKIP
jgi:hypothetical protein